ncbi:MAG: hypothetical protein OXB93_00280 [Cytophagales bacterium]|nr:hypothetical protein [Cytophagales bacterium]
MYSISLNAQPVSPAFQLINQSITSLGFHQEGLVPEGETYYAILAEKDLGEDHRIVSKLEDPSLEYLDRKVLQAGEKRILSFEELKPGQTYHIHIAAHAQAKTSFQLLSVKTLADPPKLIVVPKPTRPKFQAKLSSTTLILWQEGAVPPHETYQILLSVQDRGDEDNFEYKTLEGPQDRKEILDPGTERRVSFTELKSGITYHLYITAFTSTNQTSQKLTIQYLDSSQTKPEIETSVPARAKVQTKQAVPKAYPNPTTHVIYLPKPRSNHPGEKLSTEVYLYTEKGELIRKYFDSPDGIFLGENKKGIYFLKRGKDLYRVILR